jgi:hypothetical protein
LCQIVEIDRSSFYAWQNAAPTRADRATADAELVGRIRAVLPTSPSGMGSLTSPYSTPKS